MTKSTKLKFTLATFFGLILLFSQPIFSVIQPKGAVLDLRGLNLPTQQITWKKKQLKNVKFDLQAMIQKEIEELSTKPSDLESRNYAAIVADIFSSTAKCLNRSNDKQICRDSSALDLVRALKISDDLSTKQMKFSETPYIFFKSNIAPKLGIKDLRCRLENKKPVCEVKI